MDMANQPENIKVFASARPQIPAQLLDDSDDNFS